MADVWKDVRYALRTLRQSPVFTAIAVSSLALGIGANTALFTLTEAILLRWLPVQNPQELVVLGRNPTQPSVSFNYPDYRYVRDHSKSYTGVMASSFGSRPTSFGIPGRGNSTQLVGLSMVTGNYFEVLGVSPAVGRLFNAADNEQEGAHPYAVLSHGFWKRMFGEDMGVVGKDVLLNGKPFQVIGVARSGFTGTTIGVSPDVYVPIMMYRAFNPASVRWNTRGSSWLVTTGRLKPGVTREKAEAEFNVLWQEILANDPNRRPVPSWNKNYKIQNTAVVLAGSQGYSFLRNQTSKPLIILGVTVALLLVIACANVANLLLVRGAARAREIAVRLAIGAGRGRLIAQMLTESVTLSVLGGLASLLVAWAGVRVLVSFMPSYSFSIDLNLSPDVRVLGFAFALSVLSGALFGLVPALRASKPELVPALKSEPGSVTTHRAAKWDLRRTLVSIQVALSVVLLVGAGLFVRTLTNLRNLDPGMIRENLLLVDTNLGQLGYEPQRERMFVQGLRDRVQSLPGVKAVSVGVVAPLDGSRWNSDVQVEGYRWKPDEATHIDMNSVLPRFFEAAGIPIVLGRDFKDSDNAPVLPNRPAQLPPGTEPPEVPGPPRVAIVNEAFVRKFFAGAPPLGRRLTMGSKWNDAKAYEIVGVVRDARYFDLRKGVEPMVYQPRWRELGGGNILAVRTSGDPNALLDRIRRSVGELDSSAVVVDSRTMEDNLNRNLVQERVVATLGAFFGIVALALAAIGLYGVLAETVSRRTKEIGIRMALGAEARAVLWLVMRDAVLMVSAGVLVGAAIASVSTRYVETLLFGIERQDPVTVGVSAMLLLSVTALACFLPARRATRVEPMAALRQQ